MAVKMPRKGVGPKPAPFTPSLFTGAAQGNTRQGDMFGMPPLTAKKQMPPAPFTASVPTPRPVTTIPTQMQTQPRVAQLTPNTGQAIKPMQPAQPLQSLTPSAPKLAPPQKALAPSAPAVTPVSPFEIGKKKKKKGGGNGNGKGTDTPAPETETAVKRFAFRRMYAR